MFLPATELLEDCKWQVQVIAASVQCERPSYACVVHAGTYVYLRPVDFLAAVHVNAPGSEVMVHFDKIRDI